MDGLVIDLTHGGVKIAISLAKKGIYNKIYGYDIYNTLKNVDKQFLNVYNVKLIELNDLRKFKGDLNIIAPVHLPLTQKEIKAKINNPNINYSFINHHEATALILEDWVKNNEDILKIEVTGVKGKTSSVFILKEVLKDHDPLILSSLGSYLFRNNKKIILKKDISITPANIKETIDLAYKISNPICEICQGIVEPSNNINYKSAIFENSLGSCGIGDVGLLTNIAENYQIANNRSNAKIAKSQIFKCKLVVCEKETLDKYYPNEADKFKDRINTFSLENTEANLVLNKVKYDLNKTTFEVKYNDLITRYGNKIEGSFKIATFAPGNHHVQNALGAITTALSLNISKEIIKKGLKNYNGIEGRTSKKIIKNSLIIEEINPGINTKAIEKSINMIPNLKNYYIIIGGDYGVTCEEIDENKVANLLDSQNIKLILTGEVGNSIAKKMTSKAKYIEDYKDACKLAIDKNKNILLIYRSNYKELSKR